MSPINPEPEYMPQRELMTIRQVIPTYEVKKR
jgi:hypothetical protein